MNFAFLPPCIKVTGIFVSPPTFTVSFVRLLLQAEAQPTLDLSAETI